MAGKGRVTKITKRTVDAALPEQARYVIWDTDKKGFGIRVETSGLKSFLVRYRAGEGGRTAPRREIVLGRYGNLTPEAARKEAGKVLNAVDMGRDPALDRHATRKGKTVAQLCELYLEEGTSTKKPSTLATDWGRIARHIKPLLGRKPVADVTQADIERFMRDVANGKS